MPRLAQGPHLFFREREGRWYIRDGKKERSTGCPLGDRRGAEVALQTYLAGKHAPDFGNGDPSRVSVLDVLQLYATEHAPQTARPDIVGSALPHLADFFDTFTVAQVTKGTCRRYVDWRTAQASARHKDPVTAPRVSLATARRELEVLSAALNYAHGENKVLYPVPVWLPDKAPPRERWLTRSEAARLIWAAWRMEQGKSKHVARFVLVALYTGTRHDAILQLRWMPNTHGGWVDLERGLMYRRGQGQKETTKKRTPVPISPRLAAHLRRWRRMSATRVIEFEGLPILKMRRGWHTARRAAGLGAEVTPHILRHTFASWAVQGGHAFHKVAAALGTSEKVVESTYGHLAPEHLRDVVNAVSGRRLR